MDQAQSTARVPAARQLRIADHLRIYWRHRRVGHPTVNALRVRFDRLIAANDWDLARSFDELNERYAKLYE
ncbi:MAG: hypothetical protein ACN4GZ_17300 [Acidimicrobiales bacterium]